MTRVEISKARKLKKNKILTELISKNTVSS